MAVKVVCMGSINIDFVMRADQLPGPGQTVLGEDLRIVSGGKGANQSVAAARLGGRSSIIGRVGADIFAGQIRESLEADGVNTQYLVADAGSHTGAAFITLASTGENRILSILGTNALVTAEQVAAAEPLIAGADVVLLTLATPTPSVEAALRLAKKHGVRVHLDPTPLGPALPESWREVDVATPNETEAQPLCGFAVTDMDSARAAAEKIRDEGVGVAVVKLGAQGCVVADATGTRHIPSFQVDVVDTTAAGDAFAAALGIRLAEGAALDEALIFANATGALVTTVFGAQPSLPHRATVEKFLAARA
jgi:ribokinase